MPSRKQRRRREKERRHDYEYVYVDGEGNEVEVDEPDAPARSTRTNGSKSSSASGGRAGRVVEPPSWRRAARKALLFAPILVLLVYLTNKKHDLATILPTAILFTVVFLPFNYLMDTMLYRSYLKRTGQVPPKPEKEPKS